MRIDKILVKNYRCYSDNTFLLGEDITVFIGKNGTGKSSIISALRKGLTFVFANVKHDSTLENEFAKNHSLSIEGFKDFDTTYKESHEGYQWPTKLEFTLKISSSDLNWTLQKNTKKGRLLQSLYSQAQRSFIEIYKSKSEKWPLFAFYGDNYPHVESQSKCTSYKKILLKHFSIPRDFGYVSWSENINLFSLWCERYRFITTKVVKDELNFKRVQDQIIDVDNLMKEYQNKGNINLLDLTASNKERLEQRLKVLKADLNTFKSQLEGERAFVEKILMKFFSQEKDGVKSDLLNLFKIEIGTDTSHDYLKFRFGENLILEDGFYNESTLPMGYKRLLSIVMDLAYRLFILNGDNQEVFDGVVFIDELELHLHPGLQQIVVDRFRDVFPGIQFVFTTHSPLVISNLNIDNKSVKIIKLEKSNGEYFNTELESNYGKDYNTTLANVMDVLPNNNQLDSLIAAYLFTKKQDSDTNGETLSFLLNEIQVFFNNNVPQYIKEKLELENEIY